MLASRLIPATRRQAWCAVALLPLLAGISYLAYWLRFDRQVDANLMQRWSDTIAWFLAVKWIAFGWFRVYQGWSRFVTFHDVVTLGKAATASAIGLVCCDFLFLPHTVVPRSVLLMDWGMTIVIVGAVRSGSRWLQESRRLSRNRTIRVFIVGTNDAAESLLRSISRHSRLPYRVVGLLADDRRHLNAWIGGVPVVGHLDDTCRLAFEHSVSEVFIMAGMLNGLQVRQLVEQGRQVGVTVKVLPSYEQLLQGDVHLRPRTVSIEDLLRRDPVQLDLGELHRWIDDRVLMVTGSAGSIGSEICRQLLQFSPRRLVLVDRCETGQFYLQRELGDLMPSCDIQVCLADLNDGLRMNQLFQQYKPQIVFHAAAYKHVQMMETNPGEAIKNITLASCSLADLAHRHDVQSLVMISTDKAVHPTSVMGACKRVAETYVQSLAQKSSCRFVTVRFGNVLDSSGSVVRIFRQQIADGGPVTVTHPEMVRYFMTIPEASQLVVQAGAMGKGGEIFVLDMGRPVRILDLARDMIRLSGLEEGQDIEIQIVGMRPGEKLFEELHLDDEDHVATRHAKIMVALSKPAELQRVRKAIDQLASLSQSPRPVILDQLQQLVPQFTPHLPTRDRTRRAA